jgi:nucleoside-diphosphate-sugar epimerase
MSGSCEFVTVLYYFCDKNRSLIAFLFEAETKNIVMSDTYPENPENNPKLFCFGLGYTGEALANSLMSKGWQIAGTSRSAEGVARLQSLGIEAFVFNRDQPLDDVNQALSGTTHLLCSIPPDSIGDPVLDCHGRDLQEAVTGLKWAGYLSTTVVYGNRDGGWVDETSERKPGVERGQRRVDAEDRWLAFGKGVTVPTHLFRLAGIYGPGRSALDQVRAGRAKRVYRDGQVFSRIHVDDIVTALQASMANPNAGAAYNLCDDEPAAPSDVTAFACELLNLSVPPLVPFEDADLSPMALTFWTDNKRVRNRRLHQELGVDLKYPDYRNGLQAIFDAEQATK